MENENIAVTINAMIAAMASAAGQQPECKRDSAFYEAIDGIMPGFFDTLDQDADRHRTALEAAKAVPYLGSVEYKPLPTNRQELEARFRQNFQRHAEDHTYWIGRMRSDGTHLSADAFCQVAKAGARAAGLHALAEDIERTRKNMKRQHGEASGRATQR